MKAVGIRALKAQLSQYLRLVRQGETVLVTDRDEVIAELRPAHHQPVAHPSLEDYLKGWADEGGALLSVGSIQDWKWSRGVVGSPKTDPQKLLDDLRKDSASE